MGHVSGSFIAADVPAVDSAISEHGFEFTGKAGEYFRIWIVNLVLTVLTLGIYSAWAKVRTQRYFHSHTRIAGSHFEYTGNPWAILRGRAVVLILVLGLQLLPRISLWIYFAFLLLVIGMTPVLVVSALRFRLHNTQWRGIRFGFSGKASDALLLYIIWPLGMLLTLGLLLPYVMYRQRSWMIDHARLGRHVFQSDLNSKDYYDVFFRALGTLLAAAIIITIVVLVGAYFLKDQLAVPAGTGMARIYFFCILLGYLFFFAYIRVKLTNIFVNGMRLPPHRLHSALGIWPVVGLYFTNFLALLFTLGFAYPWAKIRMARYRAACTTLVAQSLLDDFTVTPGVDEQAVGEEVGDFLNIDIGI